jgi:hypothetical protein
MVHAGLCAMVWALADRLKSLRRLTLLRPRPPLLRLPAPWPVAPGRSRHRSRDALA